MAHALTHRIHHHTKKHLHAFHIKHNISALTLVLLIGLAAEINVFYYLMLMPMQTLPSEVSVSFAGSTLPIMFDILRNFIIAF